MNLLTVSREIQMSFKGFGKYSPALSLGANMRLPLDNVF